MVKRATARSSLRLPLAGGISLLVAGLALALWLAPQGGSNGAGERDGSGPELQPKVGVARSLAVRIKASYPHDPAAFTQGLLWHDGWLYESIGRYGLSALRRVGVADGRIDDEEPLEARLFGEGLARVGDQLLQLTWRSGKGYRYDLGTLERQGDFSYRGEGWGLCFDGRELVRSDGTAQLHFHAPETFDVTRTVFVRDVDGPIGRLNELECAEGWIYANVLGEDTIVRIDPATGRVEAIIDASGLLSEDQRTNADVLNGIAYYPPNGSFFLTGKLWPRLFEVVFVER